MLIRVLERLDQPEGLVNAATNGEVVHGDLLLEFDNYKFEKTRSVSAYNFKCRQKMLEFKFVDCHMNIAVEV